MTPTPPHLLHSTHRRPAPPKHSVEALHAGYLTAARELGVDRARAEQILRNIPQGPDRYKRALRLMAGESVNDMADTQRIIPVEPSTGPAHALREPHWIRRWAAAVVRWLLWPFGGGR